MYHVRGGSGIQITKSKPKPDAPGNQWKNVLGPELSPDGKFLYYANKRGGFSYNMSFPAWQIARRDLITGIEDIVTRAEGSGIKPKISPNGRFLVYGTRYKTKTGFSTFMHLYVADVKTGEHKRITKSKLGEFHPSWSPDGRSIVYVTWEASGGHVWKVKADGRSMPKKLTKTPGFYSSPVFTPDGKTIVLLRGSAIERLRTQAEFGGPNVPMDLMSLNANGGKITLIMPSRGLGKPFFTDDPDRVFLNGYSYTALGRGNGVISVRLDGTDRREHLAVKGKGFYGSDKPVNARDIQFNPDRTLALAGVNNQLYILPISPFIRNKD